MQTKGSEPDFSEPWHLSDAVLVVEEKKFHVHKGTLSMWSPVFETKFHSDFKEKSSSEIPLLGNKAAEIKEMLLVIYPTSKSINEDNCYYLLSLAREYQMEQLTERCEKYLLKREKTPHQAIDFLVLAIEYNMEELCRQCVEIAKHISISELRRHAKYALIAPENGKQLAERRVELLEKKVSASEQKLNTVRKEVHDASIWGLTEVAQVLYHKKNPEGRLYPRALNDCAKLMEEAAQESEEMSVFLQLLKKCLRDPELLTDRKENRKKELSVLKEFDLDSKYGSCIGITRLERWERAEEHELYPPREVKSIILQHPNDTAFTECVWYDANH